MHADRIEPGDRVRFVPKNPRRYDEQEGLVVDEVNAGDGYNVLVPLLDDPGRILRLWRRDGEFVVVEKHVPEPARTLPASQVAAAPKPIPRDDLRDYSPEDVARRYRGMTVHQAWDRYVIDTGLRPQFDLKDLIKAWRNM